MPPFPPRDSGLFDTPAGSNGALELLLTGRVSDPRELCLTPQIARQFLVVGDRLDDWISLSPGLDEPQREPWQIWPAMPGANRIRDFSGRSSAPVSVPGLRPSFWPRFGPFCPLTARAAPVDPVGQKPVKNGSRPTVVSSKTRQQ